MILQARSVLIALLLLGAAAPSGADWLLTREGGRVETKGRWQIKGKLVVFTDVKGNLASLRLADVDLPASENATAEAKVAEVQAENPEEAKPQPRKKSVRTITDADFVRRPAADSGTPGAPKPEGAKEGKDAAGAKADDKSKSPVEVRSWSRENRSEGDGLDLFGTLQNTGEALATDIVLAVKLLNEQNELVATSEGVLASTSIPPGASTSFRVPFVGIFAFASAEFAVTNKTVIIGPDPAEAKADKPDTH